MIILHEIRVAAGDAILFPAAVGVRDRLSRGFCDWIDRFRSVLPTGITGMLRSAQHHRDHVTPAPPFNNIVCYYLFTYTHLYNKQLAAVTVNVVLR